MEDNQTTMRRMRRLGRKVPDLRMVEFSLLVCARSRLSNPMRRCDIGESLVQLTPTSVPVQPPSSGLRDALTPEFAGADVARVDREPYRVHARIRHPNSRCPSMAAVKRGGNT
jgi:hypothetical protein